MLLTEREKAAFLLGVIPDQATMEKLLALHVVSEESVEEMMKALIPFMIDVGIHALASTLKKKEVVH